MSLKQMCKYGDQCYRKNPIHFQEFDHPFDWRSRLANDKDNGNNRDTQTMTTSTDNQSLSSSSSCTSMTSHPSKRLKSSHESPINETIDSNILGFYLTKVSAIDNKYNEFIAKAIDLKNILNERNGKLLESVHFNFMFDVNWLLHQYPQQFRSLPILLVYGSKRDGFADKEMQNQIKDHPNVRLFGAQLVDMFGTHHSKMMFLRYDKGLRVVIHTANLIENDWTNKTQGVWVSPLFPPIPSIQASDADISQTRFKTDLIDYLKCYNSKEINYWIQTIKRHDLSSAKVFIIGSTPGRHIGEDKFRFGHMKLRQHLSQMGPSAKTVNSSWPTIAQFSSIGSLGPTSDKWLTNEFLISLSTVTGIKSDITKPHLKIIFPSVEDVRISIEGYSGGGSLPYSSQTHQKQTYLTSFLHLWRSDIRGRTRVCPHIKTYTRVSSDYKQMAYFVLTSANLSKAAWGQLEKNGTQLAIKSYEIGVLFIPKLFGNQECFDLTKTDESIVMSNTSSFPMPYDIPLTKYRPNDKPWTWDTPHTELPDTHGNSWIPH
ncbi:tyrosyl-DNA phosphodiesterase 1-like [Oppia nitens]|uniref:tyrosyl-DNA phosphodiesterase 1-like n=1 Tax=Oppia nitens TaxID=1686743 RepID=UPI0023DCBA41|nr:tyrosyl-DNA phosphodiesterase 1-like [Oppia nitens]